MVFIAGIDEAGRGPVIGPMVMTIAAIDEKLSFELKQMGVKDSKLLSPIQRKELAAMIEQTCVLETAIISPKEIDEALKNQSMNLNKLEAKVSGQLIDTLIKKLPKENVRHVILDCPSTNPQGYIEEMKRRVTSSVNLIAEHKADLNYPIVAAASIIAKQTRDAEIEKLKILHKVNFGSGYPADPLTAAFVKKYHQDYDFFRTTWATYKRAVGHASQKTLVDNIKAVSPLLEQKKQHLLSLKGFEQKPADGPGEVLRLAHEGVTITLYQTGKLLIQGKDKHLWEHSLNEMYK